VVDNNAAAVAAINEIGLIFIPFLFAVLSHIRWLAKPSVAKKAPLSAILSIAHLKRSLKTRPDPRMTSRGSSEKKGGRKDLPIGASHTERRRRGMGLREHRQASDWHGYARRG
jgi:hypothetical protein